MHLAISAGAPLLQLRPLGVCCSLHALRGFALVLLHLLVKLIVAHLRTEDQQWWHAGARLLY